MPQKFKIIIEAKPICKKKYFKLKFNELSFYLAHVIDVHLNKCQL